MKIKEKITFEDKARAIETIVDSVFLNGEYTPYYMEHGQVIAIVNYFLDDVPLYGDNADIYELSLTDKELRENVEKFYIQATEPKAQAEEYDTKKDTVDVLNFVMHYAQDMIEQRKAELVAMKANSSINDLVTVLLDNAEAEHERIELDLAVAKETMATLERNKKQNEFFEKNYSEEELKKMYDLLMEDKFDPDELANAVAGKFVDKRFKEIEDENVKLTKELALEKNKESAKNVIAMPKKATKKTTAKKTTARKSAKKEQVKEDTKKE